MTVLTKPSSEKKQKVPLPLGLNGHDNAAMLHGSSLLGQSQRSYSSEIDAESMVFNRTQFSCIKTFVLFFISLLVMMMGIVGGYTLYRLYAPSHSTLHYRALCDIPYNMINNMSMPRFYQGSDDFDLNWRTLFPSVNEAQLSALVDDNFFREEIEMDMSEEHNYAKIDVPDFRDGRRGRFMHDFKENQSAIIDSTANRCFIMPLDRNTTLPPKNMYDLMQKMQSGYYNIDTDRVRRNMRVQTPPITDLSLISKRIADECIDMRVYMLEEYVSGVFKRAISEITDDGKFAEYAGMGIVEFNLINIADIAEFEKAQQKK